MTIAEYSRSRPDLLNNWTYANSGAEGELVEWILRWGTFEKYLEADYGKPFDPDPVTAGQATIAAPPPPPATTVAPPLTTTSTAAYNYASARPDLAANWARAFSPEYANDNTAQWVRNFATFQAYIENDHGGGFGATPPDPPSVSTATAPTPPVVIAPSTPRPVAVTPPPIVNLPPAGKSPYADATHRFIANTAQGPLYMLIDEGGDVIMWTTDADGNASRFRNLGRALANAQTTAAQYAAQYAPAPARPAAPAPSQVIPPPIGGPQPGAAPPFLPPPSNTTGPVVNLPPGGRSPLYDPTHRLVGYTAQGHEVYRLTDEGGNVVEWYDIAGLGAQGAHYPDIDGTTYVASATRPGSGQQQQPGGALPPPTTYPNNGGGGGGGGGKNNTMLIVLIAIGGGLYLANRNKKAAAAAKPPAL